MPSCWSIPSMSQLVLQISSKNRRAVALDVILPPFSRWVAVLAEDGESDTAPASAELPISPHPSRPCCIANSAAEALLDAPIFA